MARLDDEGRMARLIPRHTRVRLVGAGVVAFLALFGLGLAIAPRGSGEAPGGSVETTGTAATIQPVQPAAPVSLGTVQALGKLPALPPPKQRKFPPPSPRPPQRGGTVRPFLQPPVVPALPVVPPPPVGPNCVGAGCAYE